MKIKKKYKMKTYECEYGEYETSQKCFIKVKNEKDWVIKLFKIFIEEMIENNNKDLTFFTNEFKFCINEVEV